MKTKLSIDEEMVDKHDGILGPIPFDEAPEGRRALEDYPVFDMIIGYENEAREILKAGGYPLAIRELKQIKERRIQDLERMLTYFKEVRIYIWINDPAGAALSMAYGIRAAMQAKIRPVEPLIEIGKSRRKKQIETRSKRHTWNGQTREQLSARNQKMIEHFKRTHLSRSGFAKKHAAKYGLKSRQVMDILKMAVCSLPG